MSKSRDLTYWLEKAEASRIGPDMKDIIFLFGAGASHDAGEIIPEAPPSRR